MFRRAFRTSPSHDRRWLKRLGPVGVALALFAAPLALLPLPADAADGDPVVTLESGINGCNGVLPNGGSENTTKRLDPNFASNFNPGGVVGYIIDYPVDPSDVSGRTTFVITDCVFVNGTAIARYSVSFVPNTVEFQLRFSVPIPGNTQLGAQFCNYAKTTAAPSDSQQSNRKAGPACFTVGGGLRIEKRSGSTTGPILPGASFSVVCSPTAAQPPTIITGLDASHSNPNGTVSATGVADGGTIAIVGPSGTPCVVTESAAPDGYLVDPTPRNLVIPVGASQTINVFVNKQLGSLTISKTANAPGTFRFDVDCSVDSFDRLALNPVVIVNGGTHLIENIPVGTTCTVTERANALFSSAVSPAGGSVTIPAGNVTVSFTNTRSLGSLTITKAANAPGSFTFDIDCTGNSFDLDNVSVVPGTPYVLSGIPTGTSCVVTEDANGDFTQTSVIPANGTVLIGGTGPQTVAFVNTRKVGSLTISKTANAPGTFTFDVDCSVNSFDRLGPNPVVIVDGGTEVISNIPTGTNCTVTERDNPLFSSIVIPAGGTVEITTQGRTVAFTNTRNTGPVTITKTAIGGTGTFTFDVNCTDNAFDQVISIEGSGSRTITGIPTRTSCTVTERSNPLFTTSVLPAGGTVSIDAGGENVAFINTAKPNGLTLDKKVNGGDHATTGDALLAHNADALTYTVVVTNNGQVPLTITAMSDSLYPALVTACPQAVRSVLAAGASFTCTYKVAANGDAHNVVSVSVIDGLERPLTASDGTYVDVINPAITILKTANPASISDSGPVTFSYLVTNTGDAVLHDVVVTDDIIGLIGTIGTLNPGETRTLTETVNVDIDTPRTNIGTVSGTDVLGGKVTANDKETITVVLGEVLVQPASTPPAATPPAVLPPAALPLVELPRTGTPLGTQGRVGIILLQAGLIFGYFGRRRRQVVPQAS